MSESIALRWSDLHLDGPAPRLQVSRAIVKGVVAAPKSRRGKRLVPLPLEFAATLRALRPAGVSDDALVFPVATAGRQIPGCYGAAFSCRQSRAGLSGVGFHTLPHTCASLLIDSGLNVRRPQHWIGHHSPRSRWRSMVTLIDGDLGLALDLRKGAALGPEMMEAALPARPPRSVV